MARRAISAWVSSWVSHSTNAAAAAGDGWGSLGGGISCPLRTFRTSFQRSAVSRFVNARDNCVSIRKSPFCFSGPWHPTQCSTRNGWGWGIDGVGSAPAASTDTRSRIPSNTRHHPFRCPFTSRVWNHAHDRQSLSLPRRGPSGGVAGCQCLYSGGVGADSPGTYEARTRGTRHRFGIRTPAGAKIRKAATPAGVGALSGTQDPGSLRTPGYPLQRLRRNRHASGNWRLGTGNSHFRPRALTRRTSPLNPQPSTLQLPRTLHD